VLSLHLEPPRTQQSTLVLNLPSGGESGCNRLDQHRFSILQVSNDGRVMASGRRDAYGGMAATCGDALEEHIPGQQLERYALDPTAAGTTASQAADSRLRGPREGPNDHGHPHHHGEHG